MEFHTFCPLHMEKMIFHSTEDAMNYVNNDPSREPYLCPNTKEHYHLRNIERRKRLRREHQAKRAQERRNLYDD